MIVLTTYFNPQRSMFAYLNYQKMRQSIERIGIDVIAAELAFDKDEFDTKAELKLRRPRSDYLLWQKEPLLNRLMDLVSNNYHGPIAWIDADVLLLNDSWAKQAHRALDEVPVVQLFEEAHYVLASGRLGHARESAAAAFCAKLPIYDNYTQCQPGLAWAARAEFLRKHGFYDRMITGSNDTVTFRALTRSARLRCAHHASYQWQQHANAWCAKISEEVDGHILAIKGMAIHLFHGDLANRRYEDRWCALKEYDPVEHVREDEDILGWSTTAPTPLREATAELLGSSRL